MLYCLQAQQSAKEIMRKNPAAVALAKRRAKKLTPERRREIARNAALARAAKLTPERRRAIARKGARQSAIARRKAAA